MLTGGPAGDCLTLTPPLDIDVTLLEAFTGALAEATSVSGGDDRRVAALAEERKRLHARARGD